MADIKEQRTITLPEYSKVIKEIIVQLDHLFEYSSPWQCPVDLYYPTGNSKQHHNERNCK